MTRSAILLPFLALGLAAPSLARAADEAWFDFTLFGSRVGFLHAKEEPTELNGRPAIHAHRWSVVTVKREASTVRLESTDDLWFTPEGTPLRFVNRRLENGEKRSVEGYRDGDALVIRQDVGGSIHESRVPLEGLRLASSLDYLLSKNLEVGWTSKGKALDESRATVMPYRIEVKKKTKHEGAPAFEVVEEIGPMTATMWFSPDGQMLESRISPLQVVLKKTTKQAAIDAPISSLDMFRSGQFQVAKIPPGRELERVRLRLSSRSGTAPPYITGTGQKVRSKKGGEVVLELTAQDPPSARVKLPIRAKAAKGYLEATPFEPLADERLKAVAERVVGDRRDAWSAAQAINRFVYRHIEDKTLAKAFSTAVEALDSKEGDCTEHAVLFSALAKIAGIPTRLVTGLVYVGPGRGVFGYHEWVEVYIGGRWIPMDPTFGQDVADPTHVKFTEGRSDPEGLQEAGMVAASVLGNLDIEVLEYTTVSGETKRLVGSKEKR